MLFQLVLASMMVGVTVMIHLLGLTALLRVLRSHNKMFARLRIFPLTHLLATSIGIFAIHTAEIWTFAGLYMLLGTFTHFEEALYFSTVTYATIGYGDITMPHAWRILGAIEGATGVLMLGWSTAFLVSMLSRLSVLRHDWLGRTKEQ